MGSIPFTVSCLVLCAALGMAWLIERRHASAAAQISEQARAAHQEAVRLLRLTAAELRGPALALKSHAEAPSPPPVLALAALSRRLLDVADTLLDQTEQPDAPRRLTPEAIHIGPLLEFVISQVTSQLGPGQRAWHIAPDLAGVVLMADRRAVHQVLLRVVTAAALATRDGDWIDIKGSAAPEGWALLVDDEGNGLPVGTLAGIGPETRGLGVGLALARSLMQAHGGALTLESVAGVGTRAVIRFPPETRVSE